MTNILVTALMSDIQGTSYDLHTVNQPDDVHVSNSPIDRKTRDSLLQTS